MQTIVDYIRVKSLSDTSMAIALKMIEENPGQQETCILALFQSMYETNRMLANEVLKSRANKPVITIASK